MANRKRYPGVRPFEKTDKDIFFGRERDIQDLSVLLALEKLVVLFGKSGNGKSSLINAGLIPNLSNIAELDGKQFLPIIVRLGSYIEGTSLSPIKNIIARLEEEKINDHQESGFLQPYFEEPTLWYSFKKKSNPNSQFLIIFDQFEEFFTYPTVQQENFKNHLSELLNPDVPQLLRVHSKTFTREQRVFLAESMEIKILFSIRSDRMSLLDNLKDKIPSILNKRYELKGLRQEQAKEAIIGPSQMHGDFTSPIFLYSDEAIDAIIKKLNKGENQRTHIEAFQLQVLCEYLEDKIISNEIPNSQVQKHHIEANFDAIFLDYYNRKIEKLGGYTLQYTARKLLEDIFILEDKRSGLAIRQSFSKEYILNLKNKDQRFFGLGISDILLDKLVDSFILRRETSSSERIVYEISHDTLLHPILNSRLETKQIKESYENEKSLEFNELKDSIYKKTNILDNENNKIARPAHRYPGLTPFDSGNSKVFFGRNETISDLLTTILLNNLTIIFGKSGCGKSSIINAGLIPYLTNFKSDDVEYIPLVTRLGTYNEYRSLSITEIISRNLDGILKLEDKTEILADVFKPKDSLINYFLSIKNKKNKRFFLIFDQFEEFFTFPDDLRAEFNLQIAKVLNDSNFSYKKIDLKQLSQAQFDQFSDRLNLSVMFVIRSDSMHLLHSMQRELPDILHNRFEIKSLSINEAKDAIAMPAALEGSFFSPKFKFSEEAVNNIISFLNKGGSSSGVEPFQLQILCKYIETEVEKGGIPNNIILPDHLPDIYAVYSNYYIRSLDAFSLEERKIVQLVIEDTMIYVDNNDSFPRRLSIDRHVLLYSGLTSYLLEKMENLRLVRREANSTGGFSYELTHDTLLPSIIESKNRRISMEELARSEEERKMEFLELNKAKRQRKKAILIAMISILLLLISVVSTISALQAKQIATNAKRETEIALNKYRKAERKSKETELNIYINRAKKLIDQYPTVAKTFLDEARKIDSTNLELLKLYRQVEK